MRSECPQAACLRPSPSQHVPVQPHLQDRGCSLKLIIRILHNGDGSDGRFPAAPLPSPYLLLLSFFASQLLGCSSAYAPVFSSFINGTCCQGQSIPESPAANSAPVESSHVAATCGQKIARSSSSSTVLHAVAPLTYFGRLVPVTSTYQLT
jgi:hypothetical protein